MANRCRATDFPQSRSNEFYAEICMGREYPRKTTPGECRRIILSLILPERDFVPREFFVDVPVEVTRKVWPESAQSPRTCATLFSIGALIRPRGHYVGNACFREKCTSASTLFSAHSTPDDVVRNETIKVLICGKIIASIA